MGPQILEECIGCIVCVDMCPGDVLTMNDDGSKAVVTYPDECWYCGVCRIECPVDAVAFEMPITMTRV